ncbi:diatom-specific cyclin [Seminavis robusta]|uniref:Diatom-specific cyclin n=1 Tax=Seminavis robusta TaxID=568900 RepID=A0A9N8HJM8_9STRA|nr:diatom-specific cyclin [Seminavis robusta]|eukprot:Sro776_g200870.1 diatom-specific cyclin (372) ;mRNA; f:10178-11528
MRSHGKQSTVVGGSHDPYSSSSACRDGHPLLAGESIALTAEEDPIRRRLLDHKEQMEVMFWQEISHYKTTDYLSFPASLPPICGGGEREGVMAEQWRTRMCEWAYQLVDHFDFPRHIVGTCMNFLDRYLERYFAAEGGAPKIQKRHFQKATMCCLYLAMKIRGPHSRIPAAYMVQLSRGTVSEEEMVDMEKDLLKTLFWLVNPPTAHDFLKHYLCLLQPNSFQTTAGGVPKNPRLSAVEDLASFLVELSVLDYYFINFRPSTLALAALFNAMDEDPNATASTNPLLLKSHTFYHGYERLILPGEEQAVHMARQRLASLYGNAGSTEDSDDDAAAVDESSPSMEDEEDKDDARTNSPVSVTNTGVHTAFYEQ